MPSVLALVVTSSFSPHPAATREAAERRAMQAVRTGRRLVMSGRESLQPGHGRTLRASAPFLEDQAQPLERLAGLAAKPPAAAREGLHRLVRRQRRLGLVAEAHARPGPAALGLEHPF